MQLSGRLAALAALATCCLLLLVSTQPTFAQETGGSTDGQGESSSSSSGFMSKLFSPLRATMEQAKRLLGHRLSAPIDRAEDLVASGFSEVQVRTFQKYMQFVNRTYSPEEIARRMAQFFDRREQITQWSRDYNAGKLLFRVRENSFMDWIADELKRLRGVLPPKTLDEMTSEDRQAVDEMTSQEEKRNATEQLDNAQEPPSVARPFDVEGADGAANIIVRATERIPASKDWRNSGCVSTPINQSKCGACYAIATMSVVESQRCISQVSSPILAPQQIVDCATPRAGYQNFGCDGGWPTRVLKYLQDVRVAAREACYPFVRRQNSCRLRSLRAIEGCTVSPSASDTQLRFRVLNNERDILYHVAKTGPVVTVMRATDKFLFYGSGIFDDPSCSRKRDDVDHAIVIVGYGREAGQDYWLIKNSWGTTDWGERGYGKFKRGTNACSIGHWGWVVTG